MGHAVPLALLALLLSSCAQRRNYPLMSFQDPAEGVKAGLELGSVALLTSGLVVAVSEKNSGVLYEVAPSEDGLSSLRPGGSDFVDLFRWTDTAVDCTSGKKSCYNRNYRARVDLRPQTITWLPNAEGEVVPPVFIEDLTPFPCDDAAPCGDRILGVTEFSTIGRLTGYRADRVARGRDETERLFLLERTDDGWVERHRPSIDHLRRELSDWGRANCDSDMIVEGLAVDPAERTVYFGLNRCEGPVQTVLAYSLGVAEAGGVATLQVASTGVEDRHGNLVAGVSEGISSLDWAHGRLWATSSWDDYGFTSEPVYGGRLLVQDGDHMRVLPSSDVLHDRADALTILSTGDLRDLSASDPDAILPWVNALVLFDNDFAADRASKPNGTVLRAATPAPPDAKRVSLLDLAPSPFGDQALGLNGLDFEWYWRDHRLGLLSVIAERGADGPGAWTTALGGLWQVRLGASGRAIRWIPGFGKAIGHNRQAADLTDYAGVDELDFTAYRAVISVVPRAPSGDEPSVAALLERARSDFETVVTLPAHAAHDAGLVLQGFTIDTSPRAAGGICVSALDFSLDWEASTDDSLDQVRVRTAMLGGVCNDFNAQNGEEHHGLTTDPASGVRVSLYFAVVDGGEAKTGSVTVAQDLAPDVNNNGSKANLACVTAQGDALEDGWRVHSEGDLPTSTSTHRGGSLRGFAWASDLRGFGDQAAHGDVTDLMARNQNVYLYRYQARAWVGRESGVHVEGGLSHSLHVGALPTAGLIRTDLTWWDNLSATPERWTGAGYGRPNRDENVHPEDGYLRWSLVKPLEEAACLAR